MENSRENNINERTYNKSSARENFRHLNASNRNRVSKYLNKSQHINYTRVGQGENQEIYNEDKISKDFRRFLVSTVLVAVVVVVKILDFGFTNSIESKITEMLRSSSTIDSKISNSFVSLGEKMGINIDELRESDSSSEVKQESVVNTEKNDVETVESLADKVETENTAEEQIEDFYIDDEVLESVFEDEKK